MQVRSEITKEAYVDGLPALSPEAELVVLARALHRLGYKDNELGAHISRLLPDKTILITPQQLQWDELQISDIIRVDMEGNLIGEGNWSANGKELHFAVHSRMPNAIVSIHYHGPWSTVWANVQRVPPIYNTNSLLSGEVEIFNELDGKDRSGLGDRFIDTLDAKNIVLLANHGAFVVGRDAAQVYHRCTALEWRSKMSWHSEVLAGAQGRSLSPIEHRPPYMTLEIGDAHCAPALWKSVLKHELHADPTLMEA